MAPARLLPAVALSVASAGAVKEYVALAPDASSSATKLEWITLDYADGVSSTADVTITPVTTAVDALGAWYGVDPGGLHNTAKIYNDNMYAALGSGLSNDADTLRIYPRTGGGKYTDIAIASVIQSAVGSTGQATHTFDVATLPDGTVVGLFLVSYTDSALGGAIADAVVAINTANGKLVPTAAGDASFNIYKAAGTMSTKASDTRFKIQYSTSGGSQWHANGIQRFTTKSGTTILGFTHRGDGEAVLFKDPYTYSDGGKILQRFGTPAGGSGYRYFGLDSSMAAFTTGVHNVFYKPSSSALDGAESISLFVNSEVASNSTAAFPPPAGALAQAYEFAISLKEEGAAGDPGDDTVFATKYVRAPCTFYAQAKGGARSIGNGVFIVASGADTTGMQITDVSGKTKSHGYSGGSAHFYDPFVRVLA